MTAKIVVTPEMVRDAQSGALPLSGEWAERFAENLTKALNPGPWVAEETAIARRRDGDQVALTIYLNTSYDEYGPDRDVRRRMADALVEILNEIDFKREDYV